MSLDSLRDKWPLKATQAGQPQHGIAIHAEVDATKFIEYDQHRLTEATHYDVKEFDVIGVYISNFEADGIDTIGQPFYHLLPCEELIVAIRLEHVTLQDRTSSPCLEDYPPELKALIKNPLEAKFFQNPIHAPNVPYDQQTCNNLCVVKYWLPLCNCYVDYQSWNYAGQPNDQPVCPDFADNCTKLTGTVSTPTKEFIKCGCHERCEGFQFHVVNEQKMRYSVGRIIIF